MAAYYKESISDFATYWEPPRIKTQIEWATLDYGSVGGSEATREYMVYGVKVELAGEWNKVNIRTDGLEEEIKQALEKIIKSREINETPSKG